MNATILYRIAAVLLILFAVGHTLGFLSFKPASAEGQAVRDAMNSVRFDFNGSPAHTDLCCAGRLPGLGRVVGAGHCMSASSVSTLLLFAHEG